MRDERIVVQTTPEIKAMLRRVAAEEQRTMSNLIEKLITDAAKDSKKCGGLSTTQMRTQTLG